MPNINKNIIMQAGAAVANATNKAAGLSASTPEPGTVISAIQLVNGGRTIGPAALAHFPESVRNKLLSLLVTMEPIQDFNGYSHPWPAGGGKNLANFVNGYNITAGGEIGINAKRAATLDPIPIESGVSYIYSCETELSCIYAVFNGDTLVRRLTGIASGTTLDTSNGTDLYVCIYGSSDYTATVETDKPMVRKSTEPAGYEPYSNICPISGQTDLDVYAGPTSAIGDATTYSMDWTTPAGTVYAGSADIVTGDIKAAPYYASYNGETLVGPWVSSMDEYDPEGTPTTGAQVVDLGGTMTDYHITGQDIITLVGDNYIWSDSGNVTITE